MTEHDNLDRLAALIRHSIMMRMPKHEDDKDDKDDK